MSAMSKLSHAMLLAIAGGSLPVTAAQAQYASPPPLYPYVIQNSHGVRTAQPYAVQPYAVQPYAVQVAPNTYVIERPAGQRDDARGRSNNRRASLKPLRPAPGKFDRPPEPVDHALVAELRKRHGAKPAADSNASAGRGIINTTSVVRGRPVVVETQRVVDDPPRVVTRRHYVEDNPDGSRNVQIVTEDSANPPAREASRPSRAEPRPIDDNKKRVIAADAEITIMGPDRMSIRLFRKGQGPRAQARAE